VLGADQAEFEEVGSARGWSELRVYNAGAIDLLAWCGATDTFLAPLRYGRVQVVNIKARTISYVEFGGALGRLHCSPDGRYIFSSSSQFSDVSTGVRVHEYHLRYYDTHTRQLRTVFEGLRGMGVIIDPALVSPQGKYLVGPRSLGPVVILPGGEQIAVIPADTVRVSWPVDTLLWTKDDTWLIGEQLTPRFATDLIVEAMTTKSRQAKRFRQHSHARGSSPHWVAVDTHRLYYNRSDNAAGGGPLWVADLSATKPTFRLVTKNVRAFDVSADGTIAFLRERGVRYEGEDPIIGPDADETVNLIPPGGQEQVLREASLSRFGSPAISTNGRLVLLSSDGRSGPFSVLMKDGN
jgi:hypothetical protein